MWINVNGYSSKAKKNMCVSGLLTNPKLFYGNFSRKVFLKIPYFCLSMYFLMSKQSIFLQKQVKCHS